ncbi:MAG TPA: ABC transporter permease [Acidimicrobiia bacterium]|nr:ABC transporter permease [Acidimicrobiia bacterium]
MTAPVLAPPRVVPTVHPGTRLWRLVERNALAYRRQWYIFASGFAEPVLFLLSIGIGVGKLVGDVHVGSQVVSYRAFVAPGLMATAAMNGSVLDTTFNFFIKYKYMRTYDAILATPVKAFDVAAGEVTWALLRGAIYAVAFLATIAAFGNVESWWALLAVPVAVLIGFAFAGTGLAATTFMRSFVDFDYVAVALNPMFLFSTTFFPLTRYPVALQVLVRCTPLYQGVVLERALLLGDVHWTLLVHVAYLAVMGAVSVRVASRRIGRLLQP